MTEKKMTWLWLKMWYGNTDVFLLLFCLLKNKWLYICLKNTGFARVVFVANTKKWHDLIFQHAPCPRHKKKQYWLKVLRKAYKFFSINHYMVENFWSLFCSFYNKKKAKNSNCQKKHFRSENLGAGGVRHTICQFWRGSKFRWRSEFFCVPSI